MTDESLEPNDPLHAAVTALRQGQAVAPGLADRTRRHARRSDARRWIGGSLGVAATIAVTAVVTHQGGVPAGQITFALQVPATGVSLVGDFNDWDRERVRLERAGDGAWKVTLKLPPGRYRYSYVTDDGEWLADPSAPPAFDEFGTPTSVITVPGE